jgi:quercetin dioxygenase-like cupin family protein
MLARILACAVIMFAFVGAGTAQSQLSSAATQTFNVKRIPLQKFDVPGTGYETITMIAELAPNGSIGRHTHPGPETGYMLEGEMALLIDGQPDKTIKAGESYRIPAGAVHDGKSGPKGAKVLVIYVAEKGKPLASTAE